MQSSGEPMIAFAWTLFHFVCMKYKKNSGSLCVKKSMCERERERERERDALVECVSVRVYVWSVNLMHASVYG